MAVQGGHDDVVQALVPHANVNTQDNVRETPVLTVLFC